MDPNPPDDLSDHCRDTLDFNLDDIDFDEIPDLGRLLTEDDFFQVNDIENFSSQHSSDISNLGLSFNDQDSGCLSMREPATENQSIGQLPVGELGFLDNMGEWTDETPSNPALVPAQGDLFMDLNADLVTAGENLSPLNFEPIISFGEMLDSPVSFNWTLDAALTDTSPSLTGTSAQSSTSDDSAGFNWLSMPTLPEPAIIPFPEKDNSPRQRRLHKKKHSTDYKSEIRKRDKPEKCKVCGKGAATTRDLMRHYKSRHPELAEQENVDMSTFKCPDCPTLFGRKDNLLRHQRKTCKDKTKFKS